jgi:hypothetical protein
VTYLTRRDLTFVTEGGAGSVVMPAGTTVEAVPEGALATSEAVHFHRMVRIEGSRNPNVRLVAVRWRGEMRVLAIGDHVDPIASRRAIVPYIEPAAPPSAVTTPTPRTRNP